jgi:hypothetical protein
MAAPYSNLLTKLEGAAAAVYTATASGAVTTFTGIDDATRTVPNVTFIGTLGEEFPQASGNFRCSLTIRVCSNVNETGADSHAALAAAAFDVFMLDDIASTLSGATGGQTDFHVLGVNNPRFSERTEARMHISEMELDCYACATDL